MLSWLFPPYTRDCVELRKGVHYMESDYATYTKPEIRDYGTLKELTAVCFSPGSGDSAFKNNSGFTTSVGTYGSASYCVSS